VKWKYLLWIDDERAVPEKMKSVFEEIIICKTYNQAKDWLDKVKDNKLDGTVFVAFDHDLGGKKTGYDLAKYIVANNIKIDGFECHSFNLVGYKNIKELLLHYNYKIFEI
jgi:5S rRNA maturation endonuclease (ribonuclease M5)